MAEKIKPLDIIKKNLKNKKLLFGTDNALKALKLGKLSNVFISSNTPAEVIDDLEYYGKLSDAELVKLKLPNDELGTFCKKPFAISIIGLLK